MGCLFNKELGDIDLSKSSSISLSETPLSEMDIHDMYKKCKVQSQEEYQRNLKNHQKLVRSVFYEEYKNQNIFNHVKNIQ